jgi:hypothetical protein
MAFAVVVMVLSIGAGVPDCTYKIVFAFVSDAAIAELKAYERFHGS